MQADVEASERLLDVAREYFHRAGTSFGRAWVLTTKGIMARYRFDFATSIELHEEALVLLTDLGDRQGISFSHSVIAISLYMAGSYEESVARWEQANVIERELGTIDVESLSVGADAYRHNRDLANGITTLLEIRTYLPNTHETSMPVVAETVADYAVQFGLVRPAAELVAYANAARIRVNRPIPAPFQAGARQDR